MILIQVILIVSFVVLLVRFLADPNSHQVRAWKKIIGVFFVLLAIASVLLPELIDDFAHIVGVGRGADLLLYVLTLAFIASILTGQVRHKQDQKRLIKLARKIAILEANMNEAKR